jgi:hypothetical protein
MKKTFGILALILYSTLAYTQENARKIVHGQAMNDSIAVQDVVVFNISAKVGAVLKKSGYFDIKARENDTLVFSSLLFKSKRVVLSEDDIKAAEIKVKLQTFTNQLTEVVIESNKNLKPITGSKQDIIDKKYADDAQSSPKNTVIPTNVTENGMDFVRMYKDVMKLLRKNNPNKSDLTSTTTFTELVMKKIRYSFFNSTLKLQDDEIKLFLLYCENDVRVNKVMKSKSEFELMDFLIEENIDFKKLTTADKK